MIIAPITALYASLAALVLLALAYRVVHIRRSARIGLGDGGNEAMGRAVRAHGNATEYLPTALLLLLLLELNAATDALLHLLGLLLLVSRILHAWGLSQSSGVSFGRFYGTAGTWLAILGAAVCNLYIVLR